MYTITELESMDDAALKNVAENLGIAKPDMENRQSVVFDILDQQAIAKASADANKPAKKTSRTPGCGKGPDRGR